MRKDITIEKLMLGGEIVNKSALARQYGCCWETIDRRLNPDKYKKEKKVRIYKSILDSYKNIIDKLKLELNSKSRYYPSEMGVNFCGYRIYDGYRLIRNSSKRKIKKRIKKWKKDKNMGCLDMKKMILSFNSWSSHVRWANSYHIYKKMYGKVEDIVGNMKNV